MDAGDQKPTATTNAQRERPINLALRETRAQPTYRGFSAQL